MKVISFETLKNLKKDSAGLTRTQVEDQRALYGWNDIVESVGNPWWELTRDTLKDPMIWFLAFVGGIFLYLGQKVEAFILFGAIAPLIFMDAFLHWRTQASTSTLKSQLASQVYVFREGKKVLVNARELVPGDLVELAAGSYLPADGVFESAVELQMDESILTGESLPVLKKTFAKDSFALSNLGAVSMENENLGYAGTRVLVGEGRLRILFVGSTTAYGEIVQSVVGIPHERTPLQEALSSLMKKLVSGAVLFCIVLALVRLYQGHGWLDALLSAGTLALAATPEEFPLVFSFFLGVGVYRLAKRRALVRRAVCVESIGRVTCICTDKTGTITEGRLSLAHFDIPQGLQQDELLRSAYFASNEVGTDPVDLAIFAAAKGKNFVNGVKLKVFPFTEDQKRELALVQNGSEEVRAYLKGAPETVLQRSVLSDSERAYWRERTSKWAREGHKVLGCAQKLLSRDELGEKEPLAGFSFCGLLAFEDPARSGVAEALSYCRSEGIRVVMITGDHVETAQAIARDVGLGGAFPVTISAEENSEKFTESWLSAHPEFLRKLDVLARCTPLQKLEVVKALKKNGESVAVTGDGVNDVPALKAADIGIAMGERGTRSAKEVSAIVLADDNFGTLVHAIQEGRQLFYNLKNSFEFLLLMHIPLVLTAALIPLGGYPILYLPIHIVWLELIIHPSALFAFQENFSEQQKASHDNSRDIFSRADMILDVVLGLAFTCVMGFSYFFALGSVNEVEHARAKTLALLTFWAAGLVLYLTGLRTSASRVVVAGILLTSVILIQIPAVAKLLHLSPLHFFDWLMTVVLVTAFMFLLRTGKKFFTSSGVKTH